jgi:hypothetical protein
MRTFIGPFCVAAIAYGSVSAVLARGDFPDSALSSWYRSLKQPQSSMSCCDESDCRTVDYRVGSLGYEAFIENEWIAIEDKLVLKRDNPTGHAVACAMRIGPNIKVFCFVPASEV